MSNRLIRIKPLSIFLSILYLLSGCAFYSADLKATLPNGQRYEFARISFKVPSSMTLASTGFRVNYANVEEVVWTATEKSTINREAYWDSLVSRVLDKKPPEGLKTRIIENRQLTDTPVWQRALFHYDEWFQKEDVKYQILSDYGDYGVLISIRGTYGKIDLIKAKVHELAEKYAPRQSPNNPLPPGSKYVTEKGYIPVGYEYSEELYSRFEGGPLKLKLTVETDVVHKVDDKNLIDHFPRMALIAWFMPGVSVDKIRTKKRVVAGFEGDEVIMRGTEDGDSELSFAWRFNGQKGSETAPEMTIELEADDGQLEEKLQVWDAVLNSMQVIPQE